MQIQWFAGVLQRHVLHLSRHLATFAVAVLVPVQLFAQSETETAAEEGIEQVVVTGTKIRASAPVGSPIVQFTAEEIEKTGYAQSSDLMRSLPNVFNLGADESRIGTGYVQNAGANVTAANGINLRGLGTEATLVLVNGRRLPPGGQGGNLIDPNVFPILAVQRMEVVADGASAIYGSDAVAGVMNLQLRDEFDGAKLSVRYGAGDDVDEQQYVGIFGTTWDAGGVYVALERFDRSDLATNDRLSLYSEDFRPWGGPDARTTFGNPGTIIYDGVSYAIPSGQDGTSLVPGDLVAGTSNLHRDSYGGSILPEQERSTVLLVANQRINDRLKLGFEGLLSNRDFWRATGQGTTTLVVPDTNPFFVSPDPAATSVSVQYSFVDDFGPSAQSGYEDVWQAAIVGEANLWSDWLLSFHASHGKTDTERESGPQIQTAALNAALADPDPATAFNPFGDGSFTNPATLAQIVGADSANHVANTLANFSAVADGSLFEIPGGTVRAAVGYEHYAEELLVYNLRGGPVPREESIRFTTERDRNAMFAEVSLPLVGHANSMTGVETLDVNLALRYEHASGHGGQTNPKFGVTWGISEDVTVRGSWGKSYRAPTLTEISPFALSAGFPRSFPDPLSPTGLTRGVLLFGGTPDLKPEEATTWSTGLDWRPAELPGFSASITYYDIEYKNRIDRPGQEANILFREDIFGPVGVIVRNPSQEFLDEIFALPTYCCAPEPAENLEVFVDARLFNVGVVRTSGVDLNFDYEWDTEAGEWTVGLMTSYVGEFESQVAPTASKEEFVNQVNYPPEWRARLSGSWSNGSLRIASFVNWINSYDNPLVVPTASVDGYTTVDLQASYEFRGDWMEGFQVIANARNLFDADPPFVQFGSLAYDPQSASPLGRMLSLQVMKEW